ncbi:hypothetical protein PVIIG_06043 [Plasmodium vivax India VII]|uniref:VIR protein n=1 Tax=Plasmodium vivax India VII TaxID=1077284 RepID=A0A0J9S3R0_PLAVI|nr:hypothetical protein PVIIG_06043 [Plasmodium vivax India VII]
MSYVILFIIFFKLSFLKITMNKIRFDYIKSSYFNTLIKRLNDEKYENCYEDISGYLKTVDEKNKKKLENVGCHLQWGYSYVTVFNEKNLKDFCKYLNLWLDEQKNTHFNGDSQITEDKWNNIEKIWSYLMQNDYNYKCARQTNGYNISHIQERMKLMTYCINRDYIKELCEPYFRPGANLSTACYAFHDFIEKHYATFYNEDKCIDYSDEPTKYSYHISDDCTLYNMTKTFPIINLHNKAILDNGNRRTAIKECTNDVEVGVQLQKQTDDGGDDLSEHPKSSDGLSESVNDHAESEDVPPGLESDFLEFTGLELPSTTAITSRNDKPSKPIYYAGLSALGVVFTSTVFKKEKLRQTTNKHLAEQWLQTTSEYMDSNSENAHYNFPYQSMQN